MLREQAAKVTPGGAQTRSKTNLFPNGPAFIVRARGSQVWDEQGKQYVDWISALCAVSLGYAHPEVDAAVVAQLDEGTVFPLPTPLEAEAGEMLLDALGWPEQVRWVKTGTEATAAAMLVARAHTHRTKIVSVGYHGWSPAHLPGPDLVQLPVDSWAVESAVDEYTAGVLVECLRDSDPAYQAAQKKWVEHIQKRCKQVGALFILDEIVTGFRWAMGGAREFLGLQPPDLACFGKGMANGYAIAALVGPRRLMHHAVNVSSTFGGETVGLVALKATLAIYRRDKVIETLWASGDALMSACAQRGVKMHGYPVHPAPKTWAYERAQQAATRGVLFHPTGHLNVMAAHSRADIEETAAALVL